MAGIGRMQMMNLEEKIGHLFRAPNKSFIGWYRSDGGQFGQMIAGRDANQYYAEDFEGIQFKSIMGGSIPAPYNECKDVSELIEMSERTGNGFLLMPMGQDEFDNLEGIAKEAQADKRGNDAYANN